VGISLTGSRLNVKGGGGSGEKDQTIKCKKEGAVQLRRGERIRTAPFVIGRRKLKQGGGNFRLPRMVDYHGEGEQPRPGGRERNLMELFIIGERKKKFASRF